MSIADVVDAGDPRDLYEIIEKVGRGSYGSVFKGMSKATGAVVAIKTLALEEGEVRDQSEPPLPPLGRQLSEIGLFRPSPCTGFGRHPMPTTPCSPSSERWWGGGERG